MLILIRPFKCYCRRLGVGRVDVGTKGDHNGSSPWSARLFFNALISEMRQPDQPRQESRK
ncbi:hypothetical protein IF2G_01401 [Cordyceps javanica]|nr:hypothetical protein IF2G_01401 [Cordyceps javanica]